MIAKYLELPVSEVLDLTVPLMEIFVDKKREIDEKTREEQEKAMSEVNGKKRERVESRLYNVRLGR